MIAQDRPAGRVPVGGCGDAVPAQLGEARSASCRCVNCRWHGWFGGWDKLTKMVKFERRTLRTEVHQHVATLDITLTDTEHGVSVELEAKRLGNLGVKAVTELLTAG